MKKIEILDEENTLTLEDEYSRRTLEFFPENKEFRSTLRLKDDCYFRYELYEYKISLNPIEVSTRLKERRDEPPPDHYLVRDGVVLESEILKGSGSLLWLQKSSQGLIDGLKKEVEWSKVELSVHYSEIFFILSKHPEIISKEEYRKFLRQSNERIRNGGLKVEQFLKNKDTTGLQILTDISPYLNGKVISYPNATEISEEKIKVASEYIENNFNLPLFTEGSSAYSGISKSEFQHSSEITEHIDKLLNKKEVISIKKDKNKSKTFAKGLLISVLITAFLSWILSLIFNINPIIIFIIVQLVAFLQSVLGSLISKVSYSDQV